MTGTTIRHTSKGHCEQGLRRASCPQFLNQSRKSETLAIKNLIYKKTLHFRNFFQFVWLQIEIAVNSALAT